MNHEFSVLSHETRINQYFNIKNYKANSESIKY
jgi:hypothetical protein